MRPLNHTSGDRELICPYDKTHVILAKSLSAHLLKCRQNHKDVQVDVCRFDKTHVIPKLMKAHHESECPGQYLFDRDRQRQAGDLGLRGDVAGPPIIADHNTAFDEEDWGSCAPTRTPALFNKKDDRDNFIGPYIPSPATSSDLPWRGHANSRQNVSHGLPQTSSMAANVGPSSEQAKKFPRSVFEYTSHSGFGRGRGTTAKKEKVKSFPQQPSTTSSNESGQFENKSAERKQIEKIIKNELPSDRRGETGQEITPHSLMAANNQTLLKLLREKEENCYDQLVNLKSLHEEEQENLKQDRQLKILQVEAKYLEDQQQLLQNQEEQRKQFEAQFMQLQQLIAQTASSVSPSSSISSTLDPPPGFDPSMIVAPIDPDGALREPKAEEAWHENTSGNIGIDALSPGAPTGSHGAGHGDMFLESIGSWLSSQPQSHGDETKADGTKPSENEGSSGITNLKRKLEKKLRQIKVLEQKISLGHKLSAAEEEKLNLKATIISQLSALDHS